MAMMPETILLISFTVKLKLNQPIDMCTLPSLVRNGNLCHLHLPIHEELIFSPKRYRLTRECSFFFKKFYVSIPQNRSTFYVPGLDGKGVRLHLHDAPAYTLLKIHARYLNFI